MDFKHLVVLIFLVVLIPACLADPMDICPPKDLTTPCVCRNHFDDDRAIVTCEKITGKDVILDVLNKTSDYGYGYFMIDLSSLTYIPAAAFEIKKLVRLIIMDTTMVSLFDKPPNAKDLLGLTAYGLKLSRAIQWDLFTEIPNLKNLTIQNSPLRNIDDKFVQYAPKSLERITISNCSISKVHEEAFASMNSLIDIVMDEGKIKTLARSMFPTPAEIRKFSFK
ncbi:uncharacterized protein LOC129966440 [Argiope bruennichi]|uniref:uncharacterized protein LOC129966440 n=1 Tax=Argiope bruennichi TaxID=94029 RepID=UPI00249433EB|nr:uncharacterized protein LOC129966440 [Argiope bruennichi]